ncbi:MAG: hypothetical protein JWQ72_3717 [Polaromonas sp.]|nr:hypothetical protein [Polaromonas sp.]
MSGQPDLEATDSAPHVDRDEKEHEPAGPAAARGPGAPEEEKEAEKGLTTGPHAEEDVARPPFGN